MLFWLTGACLACLTCFSNGVTKNPMEDEDLFEGDIIGIDPTPFRALLFFNESLDTNEIFQDRNAVVDEAELWPGGIVYYEISVKFRHNSDFLHEAMEEYQNKTCIRFRKKTYATPDYISIGVGFGCYSAVGRQGGEQEVSLADGCWDKVSAIHEFGHALGLWHEHSRSDRDDYLEILWDNIKPGSEHNFLKLKPWENNLLDEKFDYNSIMLYGEYAFAKDRKSMTMRPREPGMTIGLINDKPGLSHSDVNRINKLYECFGNVRPERPEVPDFICNFETDMCDMENQNNQRTNWTITEGTLGGRTGHYLSVNAADASFRRVRVVTPMFPAYGRKRGCFSFDAYFHGDGALSLNIMAHDVRTSKLLLKHIDKKDKWQSFVLEVHPEKNLKFSIDAYTRKSDGDGIIALDNIRFKLKPCN